jgi:hypothetical protein
MEGEQTVQSINRALHRQRMREGIGDNIQVINLTEIHNEDRASGSEMTKSATTIEAL